MKQSNRTEKTKQKIIDAFVSILKEKTANQVKVSDITKRAQIDRGSFYRYFESKDALIEDCEENILNKFYVSHDQVLKQVGSIRDLPLLPEVINPVLETISENLEMIDILLNRLGDNHFYEKFKLFLLDEGLVTVDKYIASTGKYTDKQLVLLANYVSSALLGLISLWSSDSNYTKQDIESFIKLVTTTGILGLK